MRQLAARAAVTVVEMRYENEESSRAPNDCGCEQIITLKRRAGYTPGKIIRGLTGPTPITVLKYFERGLSLELSGTLRRGRFDAVHIEGIHMSEYVPPIQEASPGIKIIADWHNIESELMDRYARNTTNWPKSIIAKRTASLLRRSELQMLKMCDALTVASEREKEKLLARCSAAKIHVLPNGVDAQYYSPAEIAKVQPDSRGMSLRSTLLFVGSMDYHANIDAVRWFVHDMWPQISKMYPDLRFVIAGRDPALEIRRLQSDRIHVTGTIDDVRPYYAQARAVIVPLRVGSGTRLKILEAMASGVPVVSTSVGAEGIDVSDGVHLLIGNNVPELVSAVDRIFSSPETRARLIEAALNRVKSKYDWSVVGKELFSIYADLLSDSR